MLLADSVLAELDLDFENAYPSLEWDSIRTAVAEHLPEILPWTQWCHEAPACVELPSGEIKLVDRGAEQGDPEAQYLLAEAYLQANIANSDRTKEALRYLKMAACAGHCIAQNTLGTMYSNGDVVPHDSEEGERWFKMAADAGNAEARYNLGILVRLRLFVATFVPGCICCISPLWYFRQSLL